MIQWNLIDAISWCALMSPIAQSHSDTSTTQVFIYGTEQFSFGVRLCVCVLTGEPRFRVFSYFDSRCNQVQFFFFRPSNIERASKLNALKRKTDQDSPYLHQLLHERKEHHAHRHTHARPRIARTDPKRKNGETKRKKILHGGKKHTIHNQLHISIT